jgi:hypothetical protein
MAEWYETEDRRTMVETARKFAQAEIVPRLHLESTEPVAFPWEVARKGGEAGYLSGTLSEELGGIGLDPLAQALILLHLAEGSAGAAAIFAVHQAAVSALQSGAAEIGVRSMLNRMTDQAASERPELWALAFPDPIAPWHPAEPGAKRYISLLTPEVAGRVVVLALEPSRVSCLKAEAAAGAVVRSYPGSGLEEFPTCRLELAEKILDPAVVLQGEAAAQAGQAARQALWLLLSAILVGNARAAARSARAYANERVQTGRVIIEHQEVRRKLDTMDMLIEAGLSLVTRTAGRLSEGGLEPARQCYLFCGTAAESVCLDAVQTLGGYGYMKDYGLEKRLRDCKTLQALTNSYPEDWLGSR